MVTNGSFAAPVRNFSHEMFSPPIRPSNISHWERDADSWRATNIAGDRQSRDTAVGDQTAGGQNLAFESRRSHLAVENPIQAFKLSPDPPPNAHHPAPSVFLPSLGRFLALGSCRKADVPSTHGSFPICAKPSVA
jgi:hypothetical protein